jgi:hypothetical protein
LAAIASSEVFSYDIFWQLQSGRYVVENGAFVYLDTFSQAASNLRFEHSWLHDVIFYFAHEVGGYTGISLLKGVLIGVTLWVLGLVARARDASWLAVLVATPAPFLFTFWAWNERPQLWSYLLLALFLLVLERGCRRQGKGWWLLLPLMLAWSNLHAGAILAIPVVGAYLVGQAPWWPAQSGGERAAWPRLWLMTIGVGLMAFATPYGTWLWGQLIAAGTQGDIYFHTHNLDWRKTSWRTFPLFYYTLGACVAVLLLNWRRVAMRDVCLLGGLALMGLKLERHTPFFLFACAALLPSYLDAFYTAHLRHRLQSFTRIAAVAGYLLAVGLSVWAGAKVVDYHGWFKPGLRDWHFPIAEAEFIRDQKLPTKLFNSYSAGGYLMWKLYPDYLVFWDGRQGSERHWEDGLRITYGASDWRALLDEHGINTVVTDVCSQIDGRRIPIAERLRRDPAWALVMVGDTHMVFVRRSSVDAAWLAQFEQAPVEGERAVLRAARQIATTSPPRPAAYLEIAAASAALRDLDQARQALAIYLQFVPQPDPKAIELKRYLGL